ncbi:ADP-ribosylglycohydrolase family protein [Streptomyces tanashiensis]
MAVLARGVAPRTRRPRPARRLARFRRWAAADPKDIGLQTEQVLSGGDAWDVAAGPPLPGQRARRRQRLTDARLDLGRVLRGARPTRDDDRRPPDRRADARGRCRLGGTAILHELVRVALLGENRLAALPATLAEVDRTHRERWATVLAPDWHPDDATEFNGAVWPCLGSAVWALRTTDSFEAALVAAVDLGGDTDTVAAVTGTLAGSVYGPAAIPARWTSPLHAPLPGFADRVLRAPDLRHLAISLASAH